MTTSLFGLGRAAGPGLKRQPKAINCRCALCNSFHPSHLPSLLPISSLARLESLSGSEVRNIKSCQELRPCGNWVHRIALMDWYFQQRIQNSSAVIPEMLFHTKPLPVCTISYFKGVKSISSWCLSNHFCKISPQDYYSATQSNAKSVLSKAASSLQQISAVDAIRSEQ